MLNSIRKDTSVEIENEIDTFLKKLRRQRFLKYQGTCMYFPVAYVNEPVSVLACCLNSSEFSNCLKEDKYRDEIYLRLTFHKEIYTDW
jgi:hypothetical protein